MHKKMKEDQYELARKNLWHKGTFLLGEKKIVMASLIRDEDTRPLKVPWWRGKEIYLIGVDVNGNFLLRHCDGSVRYWSHETQSEQKIALSVHEFVSGLIENEEWSA